MQKVIVIGSPGAGKSTFARKLCGKTGLPLYYLDSIWHRADRTNISKEAFDAKLSEILATDRWIIDGNYGRTLEPRLQACDTVFLFDLPVEVCLAGIRERVGKEREEMPWIETEIDEEFKQWVLNFPLDQLPIIYLLLEQYGKDKNVFAFHSRQEADDYFKQTL